MNSPAILVDGLCVSYGDVRAVDHLSFEAVPGTVLGVLGPNGAGKTTTIRVLTTLHRPDAGTVRVLDRDVVRDAAAVRRTIGVAGQMAAVDQHLTGRENLYVFCRLSHLRRRRAHERADELIEQFGLADAAGALVRTYSGGMRRRLDLAAALVVEPPVLFLDEPTAGLDPVSRVELWNVIERLVASGTTLLLATQYLEEADRLADRIIVIDHGRIVARGTPGELKATLGTPVLTITLADAASAARGAGLLGARRAGPVVRDGATLQLNVDDPANEVVRLLRTLDEAGLPLQSLALREPSLDDAFIALTQAGATGDGAVLTVAEPEPARGVA